MGIATRQSVHLLLVPQAEAAFNFNGSGGSSESCNGGFLVVGGRLSGCGRPPDIGFQPDIDIRPGDGFHPKGGGGPDAATNIGSGSSVLGLDWGDKCSDGVASGVFTEVEFEK